MIVNIKLGLTGPQAKMLKKAMYQNMELINNDRIALYRSEFKSNRQVIVSMIEDGLLDMWMK